MFIMRFFSWPLLEKENRSSDLFFFFPLTLHLNCIQMSLTLSLSLSLIFRTWSFSLELWLTSDWADLVGDGISEDALLLDVHHKRPLHGDLQRLQGGAAAVVAAVAVGDVLLQLEGEGLWATLSRHHRELPHRGGGGHYKRKGSTFLGWTYGSDATVCLFWWL